MRPPQIRNEVDHVVLSSNYLFRYCETLLTVSVPHYNNTKYKRATLSQLFILHGSYNLSHTHMEKVFGRLERAQTIN